MASPCIVMSCKNIGTHRLPKNETRRSEWIQAIKHIKPGLVIRRYSLICSAHFQSSDFAITRTRLTIFDSAPKVIKRNVIPSIFPWNQSIIKVFQEEPLGSPSLNLDLSKIQRTYSRGPSMEYVEMPLSLDTQAQENEDPLQLSNQDESQEMDIQQQLQEQNLQNTDQITLHMVEQETENNIEINVLMKSVQTQTDCDNIETLQSTSVQTQTNTKINLFSIYNYRNNHKAIHFYTGLENYERVMLVFHSLGKSEDNLNYFYGPPPEKIDTLNQFFITLIILRRHKTFEEISMMFSITVKHVYTIFITWIRFMSLQWQSLDLWMNKESVKSYMPSDFHERYPATRVILDATECLIKKPKLPFAQQVTFSTYKNRNTIKFLVGVSPGGLITYVSPSYAGSASDRQIIERSDILNKFDFNDEIMVDKGLNVQDIFMPYGVKVNMPAFFKKGNQISSDTLRSNRKVASKRVHVERIIGMFKTNKILVQPMNQTETLLSSDIILIIAMLVNFRTNIINKNA